MMLNVIRGLMRPFITVSFVILVGYLVYLGKLEARSIFETTGMIVAFYFGERSALKTPEQPK